LSFPLVTGNLLEGLKELAKMLRLDTDAGVGHSPAEVFVLEFR